MLPAYLGTAPVYVQAQTRIILESPDLSMVSCDQQYLPVFETREQVLVRASPGVEAVHVELGHVGGTYLHRCKRRILHITHLQP